MPAKAGIHDFAAARRKQGLLFLKKKKQKNFLAASRLSWTAYGPNPARSGSKVFARFFQKALLAFFFLPSPALAYSNAACWPYAAQQGPRPDITCTPITPALLASLQNAPLSTVTTLMNEPGTPYPDGTLHYTGNDLLADGGYQGTIALTLTNNQVTGIAAKLNNPAQAGAYLYYRWTPTNFCSDLSGGTPCGPQPPY